MGREGGRFGKNKNTEVKKIIIEKGREEKGKVEDRNNGSDGKGMGKEKE